MSWLKALGLNAERPTRFDRRTFLKYGAGAGALLGAAMTKPGKVLGQGIQPTTLQIEEASLGDLQAALRSGTVTARELLELHLARIERINPLIHAVVEVNPDARSLADRADRELRAGTNRGPLHGIPILLKDNIDTGDRMSSTGGLRALVGVPARDAFIVQQLRNAGAILLGKTNLTHLAGMGGRQGFSERGGQTVNPYGLSLSVLGSSSGSAAGMAASLAALAIGTDTMGSISAPAGLTGVVGVKPTLGLLSRSGVMPFAPSQDTVGVLARSVRDAASLVAVLAGPDPEDPLSLSRARNAVTGLADLGPSGLRGARIGIVPGELDPTVMRLFDRAAADLRRAGATLIDLDSFPVPTAETWGLMLEVMFTEINASFSPYFEQRRPGSPLRSAADMLNDIPRAAQALRVPPEWLGRDFLVEAVTKGPLTDATYRSAREELWSISRTNGIDAAISTHKLDAVMACGMGPAWKVDESPPPPPPLMFMSSAAGYPAVTVTMGDVDGRPVGLQFTGTAWSDRRLLQIATGYEEATHYRRPPKYLP